MSHHLRLERDGHLAVLTLDRPERRNALDQALWWALRDAASTLHAHPPRVLILHGAGGHFCSGMDLAMDNPLLARVMGGIQDAEADTLHALIDELKACLFPFATLPCPVIAALEGSCFGAGLELALCADLRVAGTSATISLPETRFGMVPDVGGTTRLTRLVGTGRAAELILTAGRVDAETAAAWGLVNRVVPDGSALDAAKTLATQILACSPAATREALEVLREVDSVDDGTSFDNETHAGARALLSGEILEGAAAFAQKREPRWG